MSEIKRVAVYCPGYDEKVTAEKQSKAYAYAQERGHVLTQYFQSPEDVLQSQEEFDIMISVGESTPLPLTGVEFVVL